MKASARRIARLGFLNFVVMCCSQVTGFAQVTDELLADLFAEYEIANFAENSGH